MSTALITCGVPQGSNLVPLVFKFLLLHLKFSEYFIPNMPIYKCIRI